MKKKRILALVVVAAIVAGIILYFVLTAESKYKLFKEIVLAESGITYEELEFSANGLKPDSSRDYTLQLTAKDSGRYGLEFSFIEEHDGGLRNFVFVKFEFNNDVKEYSLNELFNGLTVNFETEISGRAAAQLHIIFIMPYEIGNEAQGTESDFTVSFTAVRI